MKKFPLVYESDNIWNSLYEKHGATLKHKCGKKEAIKKEKKAQIKK